MSDDVVLTIDGRRVEVPAGSTVLDACDLAGIYVPRLCAYPGLPALGDCGLCFVAVDGSARRACAVAATAGMVVDTLDGEARGFRTSSMKAILGDHPHVCLVCPQRDGCGRDECMYSNPPEERCCGEFGHCEFARVAAYVGALETAPSYSPRFLGETLDHDILRRLDLCIGCGRCVAACDTLEEAGSALKLVETRAMLGAGLPGGAADLGAGRVEAWEPRSYLGRHVAVPKEGDLRASGCTFCGACVMVCPSGALTAVGAKGATWLARRKERTTLRPAVSPPNELLSFTAEVVQASVPAREGVFRLYAVDGEVLQISGVPDLRAGLSEVLREVLGAEACAFSFEEDRMYTLRESELLAHYLQEHGRMPRGNDVPGDLFGDEGG